MDNQSFTFTVFTATYNRAYTIGDVYKSLCAQTFKDFEWLVIDDGSTDNTEELITSWKKENNLKEIVYIKKENGGKHTAINVALKTARGKFLLPLDSDDQCIPESLETFYNIWKNIPDHQKDSFSGVAVNCMSPEGEVVGDKFPKSPLDSDALNLRVKYHVRGDKWGFQRTDVVKQYPFPEFEGERYVTEDLIWFRISQKYKIRFVNVSLRIYNQNRADSLTTSSIKIRASSPNSTLLFYNEASSYKAAPLKYKFRCCINYVRFSFHAQRSIFNTIKNAYKPILVNVALPLGYLMYLKDKK
jgi:glycosyltransferase involved in cell wall biosynthesis